jgi:hypothetical protein
MEWNGSTPYGSTKRRSGSGNEVMIALTSMTPTARQPPPLPLRGNPHDFHSTVRGGNQRTLRAPQHRARVLGRHVSTGKTELPLRIPIRKVPKKQHGKRDVGPTTGSLPLPRWARGPLSVPWRPGTPAYKFQVKIEGETCKSHTPACDLPRREPHGPG